jgi:hypothetical protein
MGRNACRPSSQIFVYVNPTCPLPVNGHGIGVAYPLFAMSANHTRYVVMKIQEIELEYHANLICSGNVIQVDRKEKVTTSDQLSLNYAVGTVRTAGGRSRVGGPQA